MNWFYAVGGQQLGPVSEAQFAALVQSGTINVQTLVWREGMANWQPYGQVVSPPPAIPGLAAPPIAGAAPAAGVICCECGQTFAADQVIRYGDKFVCATCKPIFVQKLQEGAPIAADMEYAGFWVRFAAAFLDGLIIGVPLMILFFAFFFRSFTGGMSPSESLVTQLGFQAAATGISAVYKIFFTGKYGATPGKMALKIRVVTADGGKVTYARATGRFFAEVLSGLICYIGYIIAAFDGQKRALHDHICNTRVVRK